MFRALLILSLALVGSCTFGALQRHKSDFRSIPLQNLAVSIPNAPNPSYNVRPGSPDEIAASTQKPLRNQSMLEFKGFLREGVQIAETPNVKVRAGFATYLPRGDVVLVNFCVTSNAEQVAILLDKLEYRVRNQQKDASATLIEFESVFVSTENQESVEIDESGTYRCVDQRTQLPMSILDLENIDLNMSKKVIVMEPGATVVVAIRYKFPAKFVGELTTFSFELRNPKSGLTERFSCNYAPVPRE
mgnify:CR=1 FL=1